MDTDEILKKVFLVAGAMVAIGAGFAVLAWGLDQLGQFFNSHRLLVTSFFTLCTVAALGYIVYLAKEHEDKSAAAQRRNLPKKADNVNRANDA